MASDKSHIYQLSAIEKRSIVYARLLRANDSSFNLRWEVFKPKRVAYIPLGTLSWIESILTKGETEWPWFAAVLGFFNSKEYARVESQLQREFAKAKDDDNSFWERIKVKNVPLGVNPNANSQQVSLKGLEEAKSPVLSKKYTTARFSSNTDISASKQCFWDSHDPSWWREQE